MDRTREVWVCYARPATVPDATPMRLYGRNPGEIFKQVLVMRAALNPVMVFGYAHRERPYHPENTK